MPLTSATLSCLQKSVAQWHLWKQFWRWGPDTAEYLFPPSNSRTDVALTHWWGLTRAWLRSAPSWWSWTWRSGTWSAGPRATGPHRPSRLQRVRHYLWQEPPIPHGRHAGGASCWGDGYSVSSQPSKGLVRLFSLLLPVGLFIKRMAELPHVAILLRTKVA